MADRIEDIEGVGPAEVEALRAAGIKDTDALLAKCATPKDRTALATATGLAERSLLKWANLADLMRISGVGREWSELLEAAGVDTVKELRTRKAENLAAKMAEVNEARKLTQRVPNAAQVAKWVEQAKELPPVLSY